MKSHSAMLRFLVLLFLGNLLRVAQPGVTAAQDAKVSASISHSTIGTEEGLVYTIKIEGASGGTIQTPEAPEGEGLSLIQTSPSTQSSVSIVNGAVSQSYSFSWTYRPEQPGTARLGSTTVRVGNKMYRTNAIAVQIVPQSERPRSARSPRRRLDPFASLFSSPARVPNPETTTVSDKDIFIRAVSSSTRVFQNEQVIIEYQLFFREGIQLRQSRLTNSWDAEGFWREELEVETRPIPEIVIENGLRYNKIILKRAAVFPTRAGKLRVDSLRIESEALLPSTSRDPFQQLFSMRNRFQPVDLGSPAIEIESVALPEPAPASFGGAVGAFNFSTKVDRTAIEVGQSVRFTVTVSGSGNLATLDAPQFSPPSAFELYDPQISLTINRSGRRLTGSKSFEFVLVARTNGTFDLPGIEFTSYNPRTESYSTDRSDPVTLTVTGLASTPASIAATTNGLPVDDIAGPLDSAGNWERLDPVSYHTMTWPYVMLLLPLFAVGVMYVFQRHQNKLAGDISYARNRRAHPLARKHLKKARALLEAGDPAKFFAELERAVLGFVGDRLNVSERGFTKQQLDDKLHTAGVPDELRDRLRTLLNTCDRGRFAPIGIGPKELDAANETAAALIIALNSSLNGGTQP